MPARPSGRSRCERPLLYLSPGLFDFGGIARYGQYQVTAFREILGEDRVSVVSMLPPREDDMTPGFPVDAVGGGNSALDKVRFLDAARRLARPGAICWSAHLHYAQVVVALARWVGGVPVVNIYGMELWSGLSAVTRAALRRCWIVSDCYSTLDHAIGAGLADASRSTVIWDPVDLQRFSPGRADPEVLERYGLRDKAPFRVLFLARLGRDALYKGPDRLIRAFARAELPEGSELVIAGSGDALPELQALAQAEGVADRTVFPGRVAEVDLVDLYRAADVFVLVSQKGPGAGEGIPLTPLEAAACGVPLIVGDEDGSREAVVPGETGFIVSSRLEGAKLRSAIETLAGDLERREAMARASVRYIIANFSYAEFVSAHRDLFLELDHE